MSLQSSPPNPTKTRPNYIPIQAPKLYSDGYPTNSSELGLTPGNCDDELSDLESGQTSPGQTPTPTGSYTFESSIGSYQYRDTLARILGVLYCVRGDRLPGPLDDWEDEVLWGDGCANDQRSTCTCGLEANEGREWGENKSGKSSGVEGPRDREIGLMEDRSENGNGDRQEHGYELRAKGKQRADQDDSEGRNWLWKSRRSTSEMVSYKTRRMEEVRRLVESCYEREAVFENPFTTAVGSDIIAKHFSLLALLPGSVWSEVRDVLENEIYDDTRVVMITHTLHINLFDRGWIRKNSSQYLSPQYHSRFGSPSTTTSHNYELQQQQQPSPYSQQFQSHQYQHSQHHHHYGYHSHQQQASVASQPLHHSHSRRSLRKRRSSLSQSQPHSQYHRHSHHYSHTHSHSYPHPHPHPHSSSHSHHQLHSQFSSRPNLRDHVISTPHSRTPAAPVTDDYFPFNGEEETQSLIKPLSQRPSQTHLRPQLHIQSCPRHMHGRSHSDLLTSQSYTPAWSSPRHSLFYLFPFGFIVSVLSLMLSIPPLSFILPLILPLQIHLKLHSRLVFNELGLLVRHEDTWGLKELLEAFLLPDILGRGIYPVMRRLMGETVGIVYGGGEQAFQTANKVREMVTGDGNNNHHSVGSIKTGVSGPVSTPTRLTAGDDGRVFTALEREEEKDNQHVGREGAYGHDMDDEEDRKRGRDIRSL